MADRLPRALLQSGRLTDSLLVDYTQAILNGMGSVAGLAFYPTPPVTLVNLQNQLNSYVAAIAAAADLGKLNVSNKNLQRLFLEQMLQSLVNYVTVTARVGVSSYSQIRNNIDISGFLPSIVPLPVSTLPQPVIDEVISKGIGQLNVRLVAIPRARGYKMMYKKASESVFQVFFSTSSRFIFKGLESATIYNVNFVAVGTRDTIVTASDVVDYTIL